MTEETQQNQEQQSTPTPGTENAASGDITSLSDCRIPDGDTAAPTDQIEGNIIRPAPRDEPFTRTGQTLELMCYVDRKTDAKGYYIGEDYYPVRYELRSSISLTLRPVRFHGAILSPDKRFIYPQKLDFPGRRPNSWNASLAEALRTSPGQWLKIWSDAVAERYQYELVQPPVDGVTDYPDFQQDLERVLKPNIIDRIDHPILLKGKFGSDAVDEEDMY